MTGVEPATCGYVSAALPLSYTGRPRVSVSGLRRRDTRRAHYRRRTRRPGIQSPDHRTSGGPKKDQTNEARRPYRGVPAFRLCECQFVHRSRPRMHAIRPRARRVWKDGVRPLFGLANLIANRSMTVSSSILPHSLLPPTSSGRRFYAECSGPSRKKTREYPKRRNQTLMAKSFSKYCGVGGRNVISFRPPESHCRHGAAYLQSILSAVSAPLMSEICRPAPSPWTPGGARTTCGRCACARDPNPDFREFPGLRPWLSTDCARRTPSPWRANPRSPPRGSVPC